MKSKDVAITVAIVGLIALTGYVSWKVYKASKLSDGEEALVDSEDTKDAQNEQESLTDVSETVDDNEEEFMDDETIDSSIFYREPQPIRGIGEDDDEQYESVLDAYLEENEGDLFEMKHDKNSKEAWDQYVSMKLADLTYGVYSVDVMKKLYEIPFITNQRIDENGSMYHEVIDEHEDFFGEGSKWNEKYSAGDVVTYWAEQLNWDLGDNNFYDSEFFVEYIIDQSGLGRAVKNSDEEVYKLVHDIENNMLMVEDKGSGYDNFYYGIFHLKEEDIRRDLPGDLVDKPLKDISILRQFWTAETQLMDQIESDEEHKRENGYVDPAHEYEPYDDFDD